MSSIPKETAWANAGFSVVMQLLEQEMELEDVCGQLGVAYRMAASIYVNRNSLSNEECLEVAKSLDKDLDVAFERAKVLMREQRSRLVRG